MSTKLSREIPKEIDKLLSTLQTVQLATINQNEFPEISYTPFIKFQEAYYIFISQLASHTQNLCDRPIASLMFIADEANSNNIFARIRLILECDSQTIERSDPNWDVILEAFESKRGKTISLLKSFSDFYLFQLNPRKGSFIKGFGNAYALTGAGLSEVNQIKA